MKKYILLSMVMVMLLSGCESADTSYCPATVTSEAHNKLGEIYELFADYLNRYEQYWDMGGSIHTEDIQKLNEVKMMAVNLKTPECLDKAKYYTIDSMNEVIGALYSAQMGDAPGVINKLTEGSRLASLADQELIKLRRCFPNCSREDMR